MKRLLTRRKITVSLTAALIAGAGLAGASPALAAPSQTSDAALTAKAAAADERGYLIVDASEAEVVGDATFYPTGPISEDTLVVITEPDGSLPNGLTEQKLDAAVASKRAAEASGATVQGATLDNAATAAAAPSYAWSSTSAGWSKAYHAGSFIGLDEYTRAGYYFYTADGYSQSASGNGLGYYRGYNGSTFGTWSKWYYVGIATSTGAGGSVPWGNVAANREFRALCIVTNVCWGKVTS